MSNAEANTSKPDDVPGEHYLRVYLPGVSDTDLTRLAWQIADLVSNIGGMVLHSSLPNVPADGETTPPDGG